MDAILKRALVLLDGPTLILIQVLFKGQANPLFSENLTCN